MRVSPALIVRLFALAFLARKGAAPTAAPLACAGSHPASVNSVSCHAPKMEDTKG